MKKLLVSALLCVAPLAFAANDTPALNVDELLNAVKAGQVSDTQESKARLKAFKADMQNRQQMLKDILAEENQQENHSKTMEREFEANEAKIGDLENRLTERMGSLKELFGVLQQVASDTQGQFHVSPTELEFPERNAFLVDFAGRMGQTNRLPELREIERLWFELQREIVESGRVVTRQQPVLSKEGAEVTKDVTRLGLFNLVADGNYLQHIPETGRVIEFSRQPDSRYMGGPEAWAAGDNGVVAFAIDPVRGQLLDILTQAPDLRERIDQGGVIGYLIIALGVFGIILAIYKTIALTLESRAIGQQIKNLDQPNENNALGRIIKACSGTDNSDLEALELRIGESILSEVPRINRFLPLLKIIAAVAPLMGLLGTVTGMIVTFQAITLYGAGDPRLMAGGISQALITTVLGLTVAIPVLLLHNVVHTRAKALTGVLQHEAVAVVAERAEQINAQSKQQGKG